MLTMIRYGKFPAYIIFEDDEHHMAEGVRTGFTLSRFSNWMYETVSECLPIPLRTTSFD